MSYEREFKFDFSQTVVLQYSLSCDALKIDKWTLYYNDTEAAPDRETADEIELMLANYLEREYTKYAVNYFQNDIDKRDEKRWAR